VGSSEGVDLESWFCNTFSARGENGENEEPIVYVQRKRDGWFSRLYIKKKNEDSYDGIVAREKTLTGEGGQGEWVVD
jgi:hypothetical protein